MSILITGMNDDPSQLSDAQSRAVAALIREEIARRRISRQRLADQAKISISTLEKALAGRRPFTLTTTIRLEEALGVSLRTRQHDVPAAPPAHNGVARGDLGSYARASVSWIEGRYLTVRPSFGDKDAIYAYQTEIAWDGAALKPDLPRVAAARLRVHPSRRRLGTQPVGAHLSRHQFERPVPPDHSHPPDPHRTDARHSHHLASGPGRAAHAGRQHRSRSFRPVP
jgi:transcriptional regulator with XRE-family HTH domain